MRAYVLFGAREGRVLELDPFPPAPGEVVVRTQATAICTTERRLFEGSLKIPFPVIGGHEISAIVEDAGAPESGFLVGERVVVDGVNRCGRCHFCVRGQSNLCPRVYNTRREPYQIVGGGFAERITVPAARLFRLNGEASHAEAALTEPLSCALHSVRRSALQPGDVAAVIGAGTMGALHVILARLMGATVVVSDPDERRRALAERLGAHATVDPAVSDPAGVLKDRTGRLADVVFVAASVREAGQQALGMVERGGRVIMFAATHPPERLDVDWNLLHHKEVSIVGAVGKVADDFRQAAALIANRSVDVRPLVTRTIALDDLHDELGRRPSGDVQRVVVSMEAH